MNLIKQNLLLFFFFRILVKLNLNKFNYFYFNYLFKFNIKSIYLYILNLLRIRNNDILLYFFYKSYIFYKNYYILNLLEFDVINYYFVRFKSNFFCNWRFLNSSIITFNNFSIRVSFFLYFRFTKYLEFFRIFKFYEFLAHWSVLFKDRLLKLTNFVNMDNFIVYTSHILFYVILI